MAYKVIIATYVFIALFSCWFYVSSLLLSLRDLMISFYCMLVFFFVFVNLLYVFDLWLAYFSGMLSPSYIYLLYLFLFFIFCVFLRAAHMAFGNSQASGWIRAVATGLYHSHSYARSELHLWPTPQLIATLDSYLPSKARDWTCVLMDASQIRCHWAMTGTPICLL